MKRAWIVTLLALATIHCGRTALLGAEAGAASPEAAVAARDAGPEVQSPNECGGSSVLAGAPDQPCATCSRWACNGTERVTCMAFATVNTCGVCGPTPDEECNGRDDNCDGRIDEGCVRRLTILREAAAHPRLSGGRVGFDLRGIGSNASDALVVTLPEGVVRFLSPHSDPPGMTTDPSQESETSLDGDWMVWITRRVDPLWNGGRVIALNLATGEMPTISERRGIHPAADRSGRIVFESPGASEYEADIWLWDTSDRVARALTGREGDERSPEISGYRVVFTRGTGDSPYFNRQIVVRDVRLGNERVLSEGLDGFATEPAIDGDKVVWRQQVGTMSPSRTGLVWTFDLATNERRRIGETSVAYEPRIAGSLVCWSTLSGERGGLTVFDLQTGRSRMLSREGHHCDLDARRVVWLEGLSATDVFWRDLLTDEP